jgi:predicted DNA-binding protein (MmcQ/YjbR family)
LLKFKFPQYDKWKNNKKLEYAPSDSTSTEFLPSKYWIDIILGNDYAYLRNQSVMLALEEKKILKEIAEKDAIIELKQKEKEVEELRKKVKIEVSDE